MKKKILFIIDSLNCGGAEKSLISLLPLLDYKKYDIDLMIISRGGVFEKYVPPIVNIIDFIPHKSNLISKIHYIICKKFFSIKIRLLNTLGIKRHFAEILWDSTCRAITKFKTHYDIAVAYQQGFPTYYVATKISATKKIAWINADITNVGYRKNFNKKFYKYFNHIVPVSEQLNNILANAYSDFPSKSTVIYDIINPSLISQMAQAKPTESSINNVLSIVTTARLIQQKGHNLAIDAAKILKENGIDFKWLFIGDGPRYKQIAHEIAINNLEQNISLLGELSNPYPYMANCDIYVQTSIHEGFGLTISEAKVLHKPIVSTNFTVIHNQLSNETNGLIVEKNGKAIANAIIKLTTNNSLKTQIIDNLKKEINTTTITEPTKVMTLFDS